MDSKNKEKYFYFTFGVSHTSLSRFCIKIFGTRDKTREIMFEHFGKDWAFQYEDDEVSKRWGYEIKELKPLNNGFLIKPQTDGEK